MSNKKMSEFDEAGSLDGTESLIILKDGGNNKKNLADAISYIRGVTTEKYRTIFLRGDTEDVTAKGGANCNVYSTIQSAYQAAVGLREKLNPTDIVVIDIGKITAAQAGNLTLDAHWDDYIILQGISPRISIIGNIIATKNSGNAYRVGGNAEFAYFSDVTIGNISTNATGGSGDSGFVKLRVNNCVIGNIDTSVGNGANTTGKGGAVNIIDDRSNSTVIGNIITSSRGTSSGATGGNVSIITHYGVTCGDITTSVTNTYDGGSTIKGVVMGTLNVSSPNHPTITIEDSTMNAFVITCAGSLTPLNLININRCRFVSNCSFNNSNANGNFVSIKIRKSKFSGTYVSNAKAQSKIYHCICDKALTLGEFSELANTVISIIGSAPMAINLLSDNVFFVNSSIFGGDYSISGAAGKSLNVRNSYIEQAVDSENITIKDAPDVILVESAFGIAEFDLSASDSQKIVLTEDTALVLLGARQNQWYNVIVEQDGVGGHGIILPDDSIVDGNSGTGGAIVLNLQTPGAKNLLRVFYDGNNYWWTGFFAFT